MVAGLAPEALLDSYDAERVHGADENILNSTRATDFITPKSAVSTLFRNAVLNLAGYAILLCIAIGTFWAWQERRAAGLE